MSDAGRGSRQGGEENRNQDIINNKQIVASNALLSYVKRMKGGRRRRGTNMHDLTPETRNSEVEK